MGILNTICKGLFETIKLWVILGIQTLFACKTPKPLNQIQVRRIGWQKTEVRCSDCRHAETPIRIFDNGHCPDNSNRLTCIFGGDFREQETNALGVDVCFVCNREDFFRHGIHCAKHVETLPPGRRSNKQTSKTPDR